jgi:signal transduction histidine kinase
MRRIWNSVAFRLALGHAVLAIASISVIAAVAYFGTVGVLARNTDAKLQAVSARLADQFRTRGADGLQQEIERLLADGVEQDTEVYLLVDSDGRKLAGNLEDWRPLASESGRLEDRSFTRDGRPSLSRVLPSLLPDGTLLVVGRDMRDRLEIEGLVWRALVVGGVCAVVLAILGALLFRRRLEARLAAIRHTAREIEAGDLSRRIPGSGYDDEFERLGREINQMLDWIEHLMDGVRHVSNAIAHDLRTPLGRIRGQLDEALRPGKGGGELQTTARAAIGQIDELVQVFDRLLQIAEAESGTRRQAFAPVRLEPVIADIVELYDAEAEERGITLVAEVDSAATTLGDRSLLASAIANLIDNALKYSGAGKTIRVRTIRDAESVSIIVEDNGPGIPASERQRVVERFYRIDSSRSVPGNGLGLSTANAIASLHWGSLQFEDASPGLRARLVLPRTEIPSPTRAELSKAVTADLSD